MKKVVVLLVLVLLTPASAGHSSPKPILAVFNLEAKNIRSIKKTELDALSDYLTTRVAESGAYQVVPRDQLKQRLASQKTRSFQQCYDQSCQLEIGRELAAQKVLTSKLMKLGSKCTVTMTLFDLRKATTDKAKSVKGGCSIDEIVASLDKAVAAVTSGRSTGSAADRPQAKHEPSKVKLSHPSEYQLPGSAVVFQRCHAGLEWKNGVCEGLAYRPHWQLALEVCELPYRLPTEGEMQLLGLCLLDKQCKKNFGKEKSNYWTANDAGQKYNASLSYDNDDEAKIGYGEDEWSKGRWVFRPEQKVAAHNVWCVRVELDSNPDESYKFLADERLTNLEKFDIIASHMIQVVYDLSYTVNKFAQDCARMKEFSKSYEQKTSAFGKQIMPRTKAWVNKRSKEEQSEAQRRIKQILRHAKPAVEKSIAIGRAKCPDEVQSILGGLGKFTKKKR